MTLWVNDRLGYTNEIGANEHGDLRFLQYRGSRSADRRMVADYAYRPQVMQHIFSYCRQIGLLVPFAENWRQKFYGGKFSSEGKDLRDFDVDLTEIPSLESGIDLITQSINPIPQRFTDAGLVYPAVTEGDLTYIETDLTNHRELLRYDSEDLEPLVKSLSRQCFEHRDHRPVPGLLYRQYGF